MTRDELDAFAREVMGGDPYPHVRALFNLRDAGRFPSLADFQEGKGLSVFLGTNSSSLKVREAGVAPWVSAYFMIPGEFKGLCLSGRAVPDPEARAAMSAFDFEL
jgi:hypothetical protein